MRKRTYVLSLLSLKLCCHPMMCEEPCVGNNLAFLKVIKEFQCLCDIIENLVLYLTIEKHLYNKHNQTTSFVSFICKVFVFSLQYYYTIPILKCQAFFQNFFIFYVLHKKEYVITESIVQHTQILISFIAHLFYNHYLNIFVNILCTIVNLL